MTRARLSLEVVGSRLGQLIFRLGERTYRLPPPTALVVGEFLLNRKAYGEAAKIFEALLPVCGESRRATILLARCRAGLRKDSRF